MTAKDQALPSAPTYSVPVRTKALLIGAAAAGLLLLAGCGRTLPVLDAAALADKPALLVLTSPTLSEEEQTAVLHTASELAKEKKAALEVVTTAAITPELSERIRSGLFDGVIAAGSDLTAPVGEEARQSATKRFVLLGSGLTKTAWADPPANVMLRTADETRSSAIWEAWVREQKESGRNILWITHSAVPVPAAWAPSEESDRVLQRDLYPGDTWFPQLTYQAHAVQAQWIALYTPLEEADLNKVKTLKIPVMDLQGGLTAQLNWQAVVKQAGEAVLGGEWNGGTKPYSPEEMSITRK